jgi:hypothetical protein
MAMTMSEQPGCQLAVSWDFVELRGRVTLHDDTR